MRRGHYMTIYDIYYVYFPLSLWFVVLYSGHIYRNVTKHIHALAHWLLVFFVIFISYDTPDIWLASCREWEMLMEEEESVRKYAASKASSIEAAKTAAAKKHKWARYPWRDKDWSVVCFIPAHKEGSIYTCSISPSTHFSQTTKSV